MWTKRNAIWLLVTCLLVMAAPIGPVRGDEFESVIRPFLKKTCYKCHAGDDANGEIDFQSLTSRNAFLARPDILKEAIDVLNARDMPPEDEPQIADELRQRIVDSLKSLLAAAAAKEKSAPIQIRRLNRFQYNNSVRDLFQLNRDVFPLPEKLMTRHDAYLGAKQMPAQVHVSSRTLQPVAGLQGVKAFPKDLRAAHGFDNQANQLTLSPLLLDAFLRLSVSIVSSPDFNAETVGVWDDFFAEPTEGDHKVVVRRRIARFLELAFRRPVDAETIDRYTGFVMAKLAEGIPFTECMKKASSAALSSPRFLYRSTSANAQDKPFELAERLSYYLWNSGPDRELLDAARSGELLDREKLARTIDRMMNDPKVERFLDTFPTQWMQLENVLAATPDPKKSRLFSLDKEHPASLQMLLEPLLLFDAVFVEDRPIAQLIAPSFSYRSEFLDDWYKTDLRPPPLDMDDLRRENVRRAEHRKDLETNIRSLQSQLTELVRPVKQRLLEAQRKTADAQPVDLKPYAAWEFNGDLKESIRSLDLQPNGKIEFRDGAVVLNRAYLLSKKLPIELKAKTLEVWCRVDNLDQRGGGVMGIQGPGDFFDTIVLGERKPRHWISGSNGFSRTDDFPGSTAETAKNEWLHLVMVYQPDGTTMLYRNGEPYGRPFKKGAATFPKDRTAVIFGLRHLPAGGNRYLNVTIDKARLYDRALNSLEVSAASQGSYYVTEKELTDALNDQQRDTRTTLQAKIETAKTQLEKAPLPANLNKLQQDHRRRFDDQIRAKLRGRRFERVASDDPRYGGVITNAAMLSMTSGPTRTHPIARGAWIIEVIFNDPPPPPPNDVPPLNEDSADGNLTIREKFAKHRENPDCAGCHSRLDPLGFALENFDITGRWRNKYENGRKVDASGKLMRKYNFDSIVDFKNAIIQEEERFAKAFAAHLMRYAFSRELSPTDTLTIDAIVARTAGGRFQLKSLIREVALSRPFRDGR